MPPVKFKLDENLPAEMADLFKRAGHDAVTVLDQQLSGVSDPVLATVCIQERRAIVTLDSDLLVPPHPLQSTGPKTDDRLWAMNISSTC